MLSKSILLTIAAVSTVNAQIGFNYGAIKTDYTIKTKDEYKVDFVGAQKLAGTNGKFSSARLYTSIQGPSANDPIAAFEAAIETGTTLLLGIWCSAGQEVVTNEIKAITTAIKKYGDEFTKLVVGLSVGSEDLYRASPMGIEAKSNPGTNPEDLVKYIGQVKEALKGTDLKTVPIGHVDTWTAWVNGSNSAVVDAVDWLGYDAYPYFQSTMPNSIDDASNLFWEAYDNTKAASKGKEVWITETGWPTSGKDSNLAVADVESAQAYWNNVGCQILTGEYKVWWYTFRDAEPDTPSPSFGLVGQDLSKPYYDLSCKNVKPISSKKPSATTVPASVTSKLAADPTGSEAGSRPTGTTFSVDTRAGASQTSTSAPAATTTGTGGAGSIAANLKMATAFGAIVAAAFFAL